MALLELETERYDEAIRILKRILVTAPLDPDYLSWLALAYLQTERYEEAIETYELVVSITDSPDPETLDRIGGLYAMTEQPGLAAEWRAKAVGGTPGGTTGEMRFEIGMLFADAERSDEAIEWLGAVPEDHERFVDAQGRIAYVFQSSGRDDEALAAFENMRRAKPQECAAHLAAGDIYIGRKQFDEAEEAYSAATGIAKCRADGFAGLAEVAYGREDLAHAKELYGKALEAKPGTRRYEVAMKEIQSELEFEASARAFEDSVGSE